MYCPRCGKKVKENARFCGGCGAPVKAVNQPASNDQREGEPEMAVSLDPGLWLGTDPEPEWREETAQKKTGRKKMTRILQVILLLELVIGAAAVCILFFPEKKSGQAAGEENPITEEVMTEPEKESLPKETETQAAVESTAAPEPVTYSLEYSKYVSLDNMSIIPVREDQVIESSYLVQKDVSIDNHGWKAFDGISETSWQEGRDNDGIGEFVQVSLDRSRQVQVLTFLLGNHRSDKWFIENNRPKQLQLRLDQQTFDVEFPDEMEEFAVVFSQPVSMSELQVVIRDVYPGTKYNDTIISEIGIYGE